MLLRKLNLSGKCFLRKKMTLMDLIFATTSTGGIGCDNRLPWNIPEDLKIFKEKTNGCNLIVGRQTLDSLPYLSNRKLFVVTRDSSKIDHPDQEYTFAGTLAEVIEETQKLHTKTMVIGGGEIFSTVMRTYFHLIHRIHVTTIEGEYDCDTFINFLPALKTNFVKEGVAIERDNFTHQVFLKRSLVGKSVVSLPRVHVNSQEEQYLDLLRNVMKNGTLRNTRNGMTKALFAPPQLKFDLRDSFPLMTCRRVFFKGIVEELLFFLRGDTNTKSLEVKQVNIWRGNTSEEFIRGMGLPYKEGLMGPMYGYQWRFFNARYDAASGAPVEGGIDQLKKVVDTIINDPTSRRILMTSYNPEQAEEGVLYPCHSVVLQFYVDGVNLDMFCYNRSQDLALGTPFNIASSALLLTIVAKLTNKTPRFFSLAMGDCHIYENHFAAIKEVTSREPRPPPSLDLNLEKLKTVDDIVLLTRNDFKLKDYTPHFSIQMDMVA